MRALSCRAARLAVPTRARFGGSCAWHGIVIGGMTGILLAGVFATASIGGTSGLIEGNPRQLLIQLYGVAVTLVWSGGLTYVLLKLVSAFVPLRVSREHELEGLDFSQHGEALQ